MNKKIIKQHIEKILIQRLKFIGILLILFGVCSFGYGFKVHDRPFADKSSSDLNKDLAMGLGLADVVKDDPKTLLPENILNFYFVGILFSGIGAFCMYTYVKKKHELTNLK